VVLAVAAEVAEAGVVAVVVGWLGWVVLAFELHATARQANTTSAR
jgi:hypothetical protein